MSCKKVYSRTARQAHAMLKIQCMTSLCKNIPTDTRVGFSEKGVFPGRVHACVRIMISRLATTITWEVLEHLEHWKVPGPEKTEKKFLVV